MDLRIISATLAIASLFSTIQARTPPGFSPSTPHRLGVTFANNVYPLVPGFPLAKEDTARPPILSLKWQSLCIPEIAPTTRYLAIMLDPDVLFRGTVTHLLHWYEPDLILNPSTRELDPASCPLVPRAEYGGPSPPNGTMHRYVELLFIQPEEYKFPEQYQRFLAPTIPARLGFNVSEFASDARLGGPIAANYFTVEGGEKPEGKARSEILMLDKGGGLEWEGNLKLQQY